MKTRLSALAAAVSSLSMLTACGGGGGSGDTPEFTAIPRPVYTAAAGFWNGMIGSRTLSGVISKDGAFWITFSGASSSDPAGFYTAQITDDKAGGMSGSNLKEFSFEGDIVRDGTVDGTYVRVEGVNTSSSTLDINFNPLTGNQYSLDMSAAVYFPAAGGILTMNNFQGSWDADTGQGNWTGTTIIPLGTGTIINFTQTFYMPTSGQGTLYPLDVGTCTDNTGSGCSGFANPLSGDFFNTVGTTAYDVPVAFTPVDGWTGQWTLQVYKAEGKKIVFYPLPMDVTLHALPTATSIAAATLNATFDEAYDDLPFISNVFGDYMGGYTGIGNTMYPNDATLSIVEDTSTGQGDTNGTKDAVLTGASPATSCAYTAKVVASYNGNLYNVQQITFTNNGGTCAYTGDTFTGVATYVAGKLTLTATNSARDKGFMVVANKTM
ncbi:MAG: hypothetical protein QM709_08530 [Spongiibacteraceae bacterium]